jgi:succinate-acetate transporter protein
MKYLISYSSYWLETDFLFLVTVTLNLTLQDQKQADELTVVHQTRWFLFNSYINFGTCSIVIVIKRIFRYITLYGKNKGP